ncbi:MAG: radical SAM protein [Desulfitibacter sp. BRH_c19]|nr:MAG: radical SAM protein [Desulfitibacter sp. BRH_c19]
MIVSWNSTNQCNMFCDHCYRDAGAKADSELSTQEARKMLDEIAQAGFKIMIFSGGEPLLRNDIVELVQHASSLGLRPVFGTNGSLLTKDLAKQLKDAGAMGIGISLDSMDPEKHDKLRKYKGAWKEAVRGMEICKEVGLRFQIHTTVMDWNKDEIVNLTDFAVKIGAMAHHIFFLVPTGRGANIEQESLRAKEYEDLLNKIQDKSEKVEIEIKPTCAPQFMRIAKQRGQKVRFGRGCLAGTSYCIIGPRGDIQPCAYLNIPIGNVKEKPFNLIWEESDVFKELRTMDYEGGCGVCDFKKICGGCRARAYYYHGSYMAEEPWCLYHGRTGL